jgi:BASS family bile acid:Na+ symporter
MVGGFTIVLVVMLHNLCGLAFGYTVSRLLHMPLAKRKAISIEVGMQNSGLASSLAATHFALYPLATIPGAIFSVWHNISGAIVARFFAKQNDK